MQRFLPPKDKGWVLEIAGGPGVGKTSLALYFAMVKAKQDKRRVLLVDGGGVSKLHIDAIGDVVDCFDLLKPSGGEAALGLIRDATASGEYCCVVIDDLCSLVPEDQGAASEENRAQALMYARRLPEIKAEAVKNKALLVLVNQLRYRRDFGADYTACGKAPRVLADDRLLVKRGADFTHGDERGFEVLVRRFAAGLRPEKGVRLKLVYGAGLRTYS